MQIHEHDRTQERFDGQRCLHLVPVPCTTPTTFCAMKRLLFRVFGAGLMVVSSLVFGVALLDVFVGPDVFVATATVTFKFEPRHDLALRPLRLSKRDSSQLFVDVVRNLQLAAKYSKRIGAELLEREAAMMLEAQSGLQGSRSHPEVLRICALSESATEAAEVANTLSEEYARRVIQAQGEEKPVTSFHHLAAEVPAKPVRFGRDFFDALKHAILLMSGGVLLLVASRKFPPSLPIKPKVYFSKY